MNNELLEEMLHLPDAEFMEAAYRMILCRIPDEEGMKNHLLELILGNSREAVLLALCRSEEGLRKGVVHSADLETFFARRAGSKHDKSDEKTGRIKKRIKRILALTLFREEYDSLIENKIELFRIRKENSHGMKIRNEYGCVETATGLAGRREEIRELPSGVYDDFVKLCGGVF